MIELARTFGPNHTLTGIITEPALKLEESNLPAFIFWNAGLLHKVGPFRLYVDLARRLASLGFRCLRFDTSGKGDSYKYDSNLSERDKTISEIIESIELIAHEKKASKFVIVGLCSGALEVHPVAVKDNRISGAIMIDGYAYRTLGFYFTRYRHILTLKWWLSKFRTLYTQLSKIKKDDIKNEIQNEELIYKITIPPKKVIIEDIKYLISRRVNLLYIYTGGLWYSMYNHKEQFRKMFKSNLFDKNVETQYLKDADHTFTDSKKRNELIDIICDWAMRHYIN